MAASQAATAALAQVFKQATTEVLAMLDEYFDEFVNGSYGERVQQEILRIEAEIAAGERKPATKAWWERKPTRAHFHT